MSHPSRDTVEVGLGISAAIIAVLTIVALASQIKMIQKQAVERGHAEWYAKKARREAN